MPGVDNEYFNRQLNSLGLHNEEVIERCVEVANVGDYGDQGWRPPQDSNICACQNSKYVKYTNLL